MAQNCWFFGGTSRLRDKGTKSQKVKESKRQRVKKSKSQRDEETGRRRDEETGRSLPQPLPKGKGFGAALMHRTQGLLGDKETKRQRVKERKGERTVFLKH